MPLRFGATLARPRGEAIATYWPLAGLQTEQVRHRQVCESNRLGPPATGAGLISSGMQEMAITLPDMFQCRTMHSMIRVARVARGIHADACAGKCRRVKRTPAGDRSRGIAGDDGMVADMNAQARQQEASPTDSVLDTDLCIIGAGPAGIALGLACVGAPFRVDILESGDSITTMTSKR